MSLEDHIRDAKARADRERQSEEQRVERARALEEQRRETSRKQEADEEAAALRRLEGREYKVYRGNVVPGGWFARLLAEAFFVRVGDFRFVGSVMSYKGVETARQGEASLEWYYFRDWDLTLPRGLIDAVEDVGYRRGTSSKGSGGRCW